MYCINCGREIDGNIPICGECLQGTLDKYKAEQDILTRVNLEAEMFLLHKNNPESEQRPEVELQVDFENVSESESELKTETNNKPESENEENADDGWAMFAIVLLVVVTLFLIIFLIVELS
jgi:hypothetical protein